MVNRRLRLVVNFLTIKPGGGKILTLSLTLIKPIILGKIKIFCSQNSQNFRFRLSKNSKKKLKIGKNRSKMKKKILKMFKISLKIFLFWLSAENEQKMLKSVLY